MPKVAVLTTINHDGVIYQPGDILDCTAAQAKQLCALGSAKMSGKADAEPEEKTAPVGTTGRKSRKKG